MIYNVKTLPYKMFLSYPKEKRTRGNPGLKKEKQRTYLRDAKKAMREVSRDWVKSMLPDAEIYAMLREAFRGGNTHANIEAENDLQC